MDPNMADRSHAANLLSQISYANYIYRELPITQYGAVEIMIKLTM